MAETQPRRFDQAVNKKCKPDCCQRRAQPIESLVTALIPTFRHAAERNEEHDQPERQINKKDCAPRNLLDQPSSKDGTDRRRDGSEARPNADGMSAILTGE